MSFITKYDYEVLIEEHVLRDITDENDLRRQRAEQMAIGIVRGYLSPIYDTDKIFAVKIFDFDLANGEYKKEEFVIKDGIRYKVLQDATTIDLSNPAYFERQEKDPRHPSIVMLIVDISIYTYSSSLPSNQIQETRIIRYDNAMLILKDIRNNKIVLDGEPKREDEINAPTSAQLSINSRKKRNNSWD